MLRLLLHCFLFLVFFLMIPLALVPFVVTQVWVDEDEFRAPPLFSGLAIFLKHLRLLAVMGYWGPYHTA